MGEKVEQRMHFVAFLDLLGYKEFFKNKKHDVEKFLETINEALTSIITDANQYYKQSQPRIKMFSDNILIAVKCVNDNEKDFLSYLNLLRLVAIIQKNFITKYQLFLRGGVAKGMFYFGDAYVFGDALIKAYEMEQNAIYPKINIDDKYILKIIDYVSKKSSQYYKLFGNALIDVVGKERDGSYFVNYLPTHPWGRNIDENFCIDSIFADGIAFENLSYSNTSQEVIRKHRNALLKRIHEYGSYKELFSQKDIDERRKVILKYMWSHNYHNQVCKLLGYDDLIIRCNIIIDSRTLQPVVEVLDN